MNNQMKGFLLLWFACFSSRNCALLPLRPSLSWPLASQGCIQKDLTTGSFWDLRLVPQQDSDLTQTCNTLNSSSL